MPTPADPFALQDGQTVVFIGDSITDCGRRLEAYPFGDGFVRFAIDLITARYPQRKIQFHNYGISGDVSTGLQQRWDQDVLSHQPDWISVLIGINDLHKRFRLPAEPEIPPELYHSACLDCLTRTAEKTKARIILMDPFYICCDPLAESVEEEVLKILPEYIAVVREMAQKFHALHVPLHDIFQQQLRYNPARNFCPEPVHPNSTGHLVIAHAWLNALNW